MPSGRIAALSVALLMASACGGVVPAAPSAPAPPTELTLTCSASSILAGENVVCKATAGFVNMSMTAVWTSSDPGIATSQGAGLFTGKSEGQATLTAAHSGQAASALVSVHLEDVVRATAAAYQGSFKVGTTVTLWLQGFYGVASADSGTLRLVVTDQSGATISTSEPLTVPYGGDRYLMSTTFTVPPGTTRVCRTGVLQIGSKTFTVLPDVSLVPCFDVTP